MNLRITDHPGLRKLLTAVLFFAAVIFLMFFRNPRIFTDPEPFWEDMSIFLAQEYIVGFPDTLLITHSGYLHVIPRIVAWIGLCFGLSHAMAVMNLIVLLFKALTAWLVFSSKEISSAFIRCSLAAYIVLIPFPTEIYNNITNLQWWLIGLMAMLIIRRESSVWGLLFSCVLLFLSGLSGVNSILFAVPCACLIVMVRTRDCAVKCSLVIACAIVQFYFLTLSPRITGIRYAGEFIDIIDQFVNRCVYHTLVNNFSRSFLNFFVFIAYLALVAFNLWHYRRKPAVWFFFLFALAYLASIYYNFVERLVEFEGTFIYGFSRERYFVFPRVCTMLLMLSSLNILIDFLLRNRAAKVLNGVKAAVFAALCLAMLPHYTVGFPFHNQWDDDVRKFEAAKSGETVHFNYESDCGCNIEGTCYICDLTKK